MHIENRYLTWTLMPLFLAGVLCETWKVEYHQQRICAVSGSSVVIPCSFYYPDNLRLKRLMWFHVEFHLQKSRFISDRTEHNCSLKIHKVEHKDAGQYVFRFTTNSKKGKWTGRNGPILKVVDLNISMTKPNGNRETKEGDSVNLTCSNGCDGDGGNLASAFTWFKNGEPINEGPALYLSNVSSTNSGNYSCSLKTHRGATSGVINIDVEYGPRNTSVSVRPSTEVDENSNVTLICSSHANPPVENYTWFKIHDDDNTMDVGHQPVFFPGDGGQYICRATNKHGSQNSSVVTLTMKCSTAHWATFTRLVLIIAVVAVLLIVITVIGVSRLHKKRKPTPNIDSEEEAQDTDYVNWLTCDDIHSQERNQCEGGGAEVVYTSVYFNNNRKSNMEQQMDSHTHDEDVIYIAVYTGTNS